MVFRYLNLVCIEDKIQKASSSLQHYFTILEDKVCTTGWRPAQLLSGWILSSFLASTRRCSHQHWFTLLSQGCVWAACLLNLRSWLTFYCQEFGACFPPAFINFKLSCSMPSFHQPSKNILNSKPCFPDGSTLCCSFLSFLGQRYPFMQLNFPKTLMGAHTLQ